MPCPRAPYPEGVTSLLPVRGPPLSPEASCSSASWGSEGTGQGAHPEETPPASGHPPNSSSPLCSRCLYSGDGLGGPRKIICKGQRSVNERLRGRDADAWDSELWRGARERAGGQGWLLRGSAPFSSSGTSGTCPEWQARPSPSRAPSGRCRSPPPPPPSWRPQLSLWAVRDPRAGEPDLQPSLRAPVQWLEPAVCCTASPQPLLGPRSPDNSAKGRASGLGSSIGHCHLGASLPLDQDGECPPSPLTPESHRSPRAHAPAPLSLGVRPRQGLGLSEECLPSAVPVSRASF